MKFLSFIFIFLILPYLIIINIWMIIVSLKNIDITDIPNSKDKNELTQKWLNKDLNEFHKNLPYIFKLVPTIIILYFYFR